MLYLRPQPTFQDFQKYIHAFELERGFMSETVVQECLLLGEELGEFFELVEHPDKHHFIGGELADIFIFPCAIANRTAINMDEAFAQECGIAVGTPLVDVQKIVDTSSRSLTSLSLELGAKVGKLCKAVRKLEKIKMGTHSQAVNTQTALIEVFTALFAVANCCSINLEQAFRDKEEINKKRVWTVSVPVETRSQELL